MSSNSTQPSISATLVVNADGTFSASIDVQVPNQTFQIQATPQRILDSRYPSGSIPPIPPANSIAWQTLPSLPNEQQGTGFTYNFANYLTITGTVTGITYSIVNGTLPPGCSLNASTGLLTYSGTGVGSSIFQIMASATGVQSATSAPFSLQIFAPAAPDTFAPSIPTGLSCAPAAASLTWTWDPCVDPFVGSQHSGLANYLVKVDSGAPQTVAAAAGLANNWQYNDVGAVGATGNYLFAGDGLEVGISSAGSDIYGTADAFGWVNSVANGDDEIILELTAFTATTEYAKAGAMFRQSQSVANDITVLLVYQAVADTLQLMSRPTVGGSMVINATINAPALPFWLKLVRTGNSFAGFYSTDSQNWVAVSAPISVPMNTAAYAGACCCSHILGSLASMSVRQLNNTPPAPTPAPTFSLTGLGSSVTHAIQVAAQDASGNIGAYCAAVSGTTSAASGGGGPPPTGVFGVKRSGGGLVSTLDGSKVQLRGANLSCLQGNYAGATTPIKAQNLGSTASAATIQAYMAGANLGSYPYWGYVKNTFKMNCIRIPMNEATYLRTYTGQDISTLAGLQLPDNASSQLSGQYRSVIKQIVADMNAAGIYVILDLHWSAPGPYLSGGNNGQVQLPDADHSPAFWTQLAQDFGQNPGVIFELFNEPYQGGGSQQQAFENLRDGTTETTISFNSGKSTISYNWTTAGYQSLVNAVRAAGGTNLIVVGGALAATDLSGYSAAGGVNGGPYFPIDSLSNIAAAWHSYGVSSANSTVNNGSYTGTINPTTAAKNCIAAGIPVIITECGAGDSASADYATQWADANNEQGHALIWTYDNWGGGGAIVGNNPPVANGWAATFMSWLQNHA